MYTRYSNMIFMILACILVCLMGKDVDFIDISAFFV